MADDLQLLRQFVADGSQAAFGDLVRRYLPLVYHAALRQTRSRPLAEEVAQEVFCRAALKAPRLLGHSSLAGWFHTATRYAADHAVRGELRRRRREQEAVVIESIHSPEKNAADWERLAPAIDRVLGEGNARDREVILLRFFRGQPFAEIGSQLGLSTDAARFRVERALDRMKSRLAKQGIYSTAAALTTMLAAQSEAAVPAGLGTRLAAISLAHAAGPASAGVAGLIQFMTGTKMMAVAGLALAGLALCGGWHEWKQLRSAREGAAAAASNYAAGLARRGALEREIQAGERSSADLKREIATLHAKSPPRAATSAARSVAAKPKPADPRISLDPEVHADLRAYIRGMIAHDQRPGLRQQGLTLLQQEQVIDFRLSDTTASVGSIHGDFSDPEATDAQPDASSLIPNAKHLETSVTQSNFRDLVEALAGNLYDTATPLSGQQGEQLVQALVQAAPNPAPTSNPDPKSIDWDAALNRATAILSAPQIETLRSEAAILQTGDWFNWTAPGTLGHDAHP